MPQFVVHYWSWVYWAEIAWDVLSAFRIINTIVRLFIFFVFNVMVLRYAAHSESTMHCRSLDHIATTWKRRKTSCIYNIKDDEQQALLNSELNDIFQVHTLICVCVCSRQTSSYWRLARFCSPSVCYRQVSTWTVGSMWESSMERILR